MLAFKIPSRIRYPAKAFLHENPGMLLLHHVHVSLTNFVLM